MPSVIITTPGSQYYQHTTIQMKKKEAEVRGCHQCHTALWGAECSLKSDSPDLQQSLHMMISLGIPELETLIRGRDHLSLDNHVSMEQTHYPGRTRIYPWENEHRTALWGCSFRSLKGKRSLPVASFPGSLYLSLSPQTTTPLRCCSSRSQRDPCIDFPTSSLPSVPLPGSKRCPRQENPCVVSVTILFPFQYYQSSQGFSKIHSRWKLTYTVKCIIWM